MVKLTNGGNEFTGTLLSSNPNGEAQDVRDLFISEIQVNGEPIQAEMDEGSRKRVIDLGNVALGGRIKTISLQGSDGGKIDAEIDAEGNATIPIDEMELGTFKANNLIVNQFNVGLFFQTLQSIAGEEKIEGDEYTLPDLKDKFNNLLNAIKTALETSAITSAEQDVEEGQ